MWATVGANNLVYSEDDLTGSNESAPLSDAAGVFPSLVHQGDIVDFLKLLSAATKKNIIPSRQVRGPVEVNLFDVTYKEALEAVLKANGYAYEEKGIFIYVYTEKEYFELTESSKRLESRIFHLNYIPAADVATIIAPVLSQNAKVTTSPDAGQATDSSGDTWASNSYVVVMDYPEQLEQVAVLIEEVDRRPAQVMVEATILVANLSDNNKFGVDFNVLGGLDFTSLSGQSQYVTKPGTSGEFSGTELAVGAGKNGLSVGILKSELSIMIEALETITDVVTIGNPKILTLNRQQGKVIVGNRDGYVTTEVSQTTATQTVQFLETGTQLKFRPFVMEDGYIRMELDTEDSDGGVTVSGSFTLPSETTANVQSNVLVKNGHTIVIGGLFRDKSTFTRTQVPILGNVPGLGQIFRETTDDIEKEEVIFLITPHIVEEAVDYAAADQVMENIGQLLLGVRDGMMFQSRSSMASSHFQLARQNQAMGDLDQALWHATVATQCNPGFLDAIRLREDLLGRELYREQIGSMQWYMSDLLHEEYGVETNSSQETTVIDEVAIQEDVNDFQNLIAEDPNNMAQPIDLASEDQIAIEALNLSIQEDQEPVVIADEQVLEQDESDNVVEVVVEVVGDTIDDVVDVVTGQDDSEPVDDETPLEETPVTEEVEPSEEDAPAEIESQESEELEIEESEVDSEESFEEIPVEMD